MTYDLSISFGITECTLPLAGGWTCVLDLHETRKKVIKFKFFHGERDHKWLLSI